MKQLKQRIVAAIVNHGGTVMDLSKGKNANTILVGYRGTNTLLTLKDGTQSIHERHLTEEELATHSSWRGKIRIANSVTEALHLVGATNE